MTYDPQRPGHHNIAINVRQAFKEHGLGRREYDDAELYDVYATYADIVANEQREDGGDGTQNEAFWRELSEIIA